MAKSPLNVSDPASDSFDDARLIRRWLIIFILIGLLWRLVRFGLVFPIWGDEAMLGLNVLGRSYRELLQPLKYVQVAPIGFLWMLRFTFDHLGLSDYTTRLPALVAGIIALLLFWYWAKTLVSHQAAMFATAVVAVSGYIVRHGVELKPYGMDFLAAVTLLLIATRYLTSHRVVWLIALIAVQPICSAISYPQVFVAIAIAIALVWNAIAENWSRRFLVGIYCLVLGASMLVVVTTFARGQYHASAQWMLPYWRNGFPPPNPLKFIRWFVLIHTGNLFAYPIGGKNCASLGTLILFCIGLRSMWRQWSFPIRLMLFSPFALTFIAAVFRIYPYGESARVSLHLAPVIILAAAVGIAALLDTATTRRHWHRGVNLTGIVLLGIAVVGLAANVIWPYRIKADANMRSTVRRLLSSAGNEPIFLLHPSDQGPPTLLWYLEEQGRSYAHGMIESPGDLSKTRNAWVITCAAAHERLGKTLAGAPFVRIVSASILRARWS